MTLASLLKMNDKDQEHGSGLREQGVFSEVMEVRREGKECPGSWELTSSDTK